MSGFSTKLHGSVCYYYQSFVGRDFKGWTQMALFILGPYLSDGQKEVTAVERLVEWTAVERWKLVGPGNWTFDVGMVQLAVG